MIEMVCSQWLVVVMMIVLLWHSIKTIYLHLRARKLEKLVKYKSHIDEHIYLSLLSLLGGIALPIVIRDIQYLSVYHIVAIMIITQIKYSLTHLTKELTSWGYQWKMK